MSSEYLEYVDTIAENLRKMRILVAGALYLSENCFCDSEMNDEPERREWWRRNDMDTALYQIRDLVSAMQKAGRGL